MFQIWHVGEHNQQSNCTVSSSALESGRSLARATIVPSAPSTESTQSLFKDGGPGLRHRGSAELDVHVSSSGRRCISLASVGVFFLSRCPPPPAVIKKALCERG